MKENDFNARVLELLSSKQYAALHRYLDTLNPADIAETMEDLLSDERITTEDLARIFRLLPKELAADAFVEMDSDLQEALITAFSDKELREVIDDMFLDDTVDVIEEMPANVVKRILKNVSPEMRQSINEVLNYPEDSAGSIMTIEYVDLRPDMTVQEAFDHIRKTGVDKETIYTCYVVSAVRKLLGLVSVKDLLLANYGDKIRDVMETRVISVRTQDDQEEVANLFAKYDFTALPVVDRESRLVGIVTVDDAIEVMQEEATEDIEKMAAIMPSEHTYFKSGIQETWKQRIPWLLILMVSATFTGMIISSFEDALAAQVVLTAFIPMLMDTGGNSGSQSSVTIIRGMSLGDIEFSDLWRVVWKESRVALLCGVTLAAVNFAKILLVDRMLLHNPSVTIPVAAVVCLTLISTVFFAKLVGCTLPMVAKRLGFDPAVMASPLLTTIVDAVTLLIYFQSAKLLLGL
ncbi:MAG: magnesium transporter [Clostridiaceae bacterium]|nr:magnesium transporter [Clostridiaceae bacterium]